MLFGISHAEPAAMSTAYDTDLDRNAANFVALSPLSFIARTAAVYPHRLAIIHGARRQTWAQTYARCRELASALKQWGIRRGDTVAVMLPNIPEMLEAHFGVPMTGAVLNALNTRLEPDAIAFMLAHGEAKVLITDREFAPTIAKALAMLTGPKPRVIDVDDPLCDNPGELLGEIGYEAFVASGDPQAFWSLPADEWDAIALNYTSGTTGNPKGVVIHHRGAYLNAVSNLLSWSVPQHAIYLWTLPMFHCNGWTFPWAMALNAGVNVCLRKVDPALIFSLIREHDVTHMCGAPIVYGMLINAPAELRQGIEHVVQGQVAGAAPPAAIIEGCELAGINLTHVYGLTEVYGPSAICAPQDGWESLDIGERARLNGRQGVPYHLQEATTVIDPETGIEVPADGETLGEVVFRGNIVMKGYLKNPKATQEAFAGGWFRTGDLAVREADGYVKIKDRSKDIIISGGENISSLEVEEVLYRHPAIVTAAVVAKPDEKWGEVPCAFVELRTGFAPTEAEVISFCRGHLAGFKVPKAVVFGLIPKTSTGKLQKFVLRQQLQSASAIA